ncbi:HD domain-containing protein [Myxococcus sp. CA051A]|uniref:HD domain-containing phosphohydrolase n=1 Tax=unclassified Myxococcus TaxID=2648731 RepID=UPI00157AD171|nr:HD domain-containing protein [Myxococcus sp. CA040A]NTX17768.1 HD domain-containing protein [Myxococcus sp. CA056]NTX55682.1 HD domain-containing protein [Myxococcus sp. CA039A]NTX65989.1 HD domain-containing protein [Myxococcus sp. CA051A]
MRLFKAILLLMLVVSIVPTLMVGWLSVTHTRELLVRDAQELAQERVKQLRLKAEIFLGEPTEAVMGLARVPDFFGLPLEAQQTHLASVLSQRREVLALTVFGPDGKRLPGLQAFSRHDVPPTALASHEERGRALLEGGMEGPRYSDVVATGGGGPVVTLAFPVGEPVKGFITADLSLAGLRQMLEQERVGSTGFAYLSDHRGHLVVGGGGVAALGGDVSQRSPVAHLLRQLASTPDAELFHVGNFGEGRDAVVAAYTVLPETGWAIVSEQPVEHAYRQVETMERRILLGLGAAILVALVMAALFSRNLTRPLKVFTDGALELARGKFGVEVKIPQKNEVGELAQTFNYMSKQLLAYDMENRGLYESLEKGYLETIVALANSIDSKDAYTRGHSQRVGDLSVEIGRELNLTERELRQLQYGGILHDIGKIGIVESILCKQTKLTDQEMAIMREHPAIGDAIIGPVSFLGAVRACVRHHHERWDGTGYPDKLRGDDIPLLARIVACADTFDACTSTRPYQKAMPLEKAMEILDSLTGAQLDPQVVAALQRVVAKKGVRLEGHRLPVKLAS